MLKASPSRLPTVLAVATAWSLVSTADRVRSARSPVRLRQWDGTRAAVVPAHRTEHAPSRRITGSFHGHTVSLTTP